MSATLVDFPGTGTFARGIHPPERKQLAEDAAIEVMPTPPKISLPLLQHAGAACEALVKVKDLVSAGDKIGSSDAFITAPVHTPVAGKVVRPSVATLPNGRHVKTVSVKPDSEQVEGEALREKVLGGDWQLGKLDGFSREEITEAVKEAGVVGLGGAAFPTYVKFLPNPDKPVDTVLVNGCECEPYLTSDYRLMLEAREAVIAGAALAGKAAGAQRVVIAVEDNKRLAIEVLRLAADGTGVEVAQVKTKYPMGGERQVIPAVLKREVPTGGLPLDVGVVVVNVGTCAAIAGAVLRKAPLTHRVVSVTGGGIRKPRNLLVATGTACSELIDYCGGLTADADRVIAGGPMMGFTVGQLSTPVSKGLSGLVVLTRDDVRRAEETNCVRCGRCVDVCPLHLVPTRIALAAKNEDWDLAKRYHLRACMECGCCAYVCPASIPLVQLIRVGKAAMPKE